MTGRISDNVRSSFATALLCTVWMLLANTVGLLGWAGFAGCTAYFAAPQKGIRGLPVLFACICSGMLYAMLSIYAGNRIPGEVMALVLTFLTTFFMCAGGKRFLLSFVPGAFVGSFSTFAAGGNLMIIPSLLVGVLLGLSCDSFGTWLCKQGKNTCAAQE